jgi:hypothetical protein
MKGFFHINPLWNNKNFVSKVEAIVNYARRPCTVTDPGIRHYFPTAGFSSWFILSNIILKVSHGVPSPSGVVVLP